ASLRGAVASRRVSRGNRRTLLNARLISGNPSGCFLAAVSRCALHRGRWERLQKAAHSPLLRRGEREETVLRRSYAGAAPHADPPALGWGEGEAPSPKLPAGVIRGSVSGFAVRRLSPRR